MSLIHPKGGNAIVADATSNQLRYSELCWCNTCQSFVFLQKTPSYSSNHGSLTEHVDDVGFSWFRCPKHPTDNQRWLENRKESLGPFDFLTVRSFYIVTKPTTTSYRPIHLTLFIFHRWSELIDSFLHDIIITLPIQCSRSNYKRCWMCFRVSYPPHAEEERCRVHLVGKAVGGLWNGSQEMVNDRDLQCSDAYLHNMGENKCDKQPRRVNKKTSSN